ncbi:hypothetical protein F0L74_20875 [Chitinophaga agrisoli]|uniref:Uncharacterized protein n=1 Tax=Chitinophaga agrisoli TaxID=2607653 RepID=A0A5B2VID1_9BACT|nr:hypothetical protein [Chitinophaga agrisoli]KAA2238675.1 hypothetical protein F0L74_20875 [Chitinophaga agrisoli]
MTVKEAKSITRSWVDKEAPCIQGFMGAFFHGAVNWLADEDTLPAASDIDVMIVVTDPPPHPLGKFRYGPLLLEVSYLSMSELRSPEQVLGTFYLAGSFHKPGIIADTSGWLTTLQQAVAAQYTDAHWIRQRCSHAQHTALNFIHALNEHIPVHDQVTSWLFARGLLAHILLVAGLQNPTVRKRYVALQQLLEKYQALDLYEQLLHLSGFDALTPAAVAQHLAALTAAFDSAAEVIRTPYRFAADISQAARSVAIDGSYELLETGYHREAMFWITATWCRCRHILTQDAPPHIQVQHDAGFRQLLEELHIDSFKNRDRSNRHVIRMMPRVWKMAEKIMERQ